MNELNGAGESMQRSSNRTAHFVDYRVATDCFEPFRFRRVRSAWHRKCPFFRTGLLPLSALFNTLFFYQERCKKVDFLVAAVRRVNQYTVGF